MGIKKLGPWNWFKKEDELGTKSIPVRREEAHKHHPALPAALQNFQREFDRIFEQAFSGFGIEPSWLGGMQWPRGADGMLKPTLDLAATDKEYKITVEIPGVDEKDVKIEIANDTLMIHGEKKQEQEERDKDYYRVERSYGSFERLLALPDDADQESVKAAFKKGVLTIRISRKALPKEDIRKIEIKSA